MPNGFTNIKGLQKGTQEVLLVGGSKNLKFLGFKVSPSQPTDDQLAKIRRFTRRDFTAEELYVGQIRMTNNAIDRDNERFHEEVLTRFAATTLRRTMLLDHDRTVRDSAIGKYFDVEIEKLPLQQAIQETGEQLKLPAGITEVWFHSPWFYIPRKAVDEREIIKIDAGIYDFSSIGFRADKLVPVFDPADPGGSPLYWEYRGTSEDTEMTEGSLVYLGAQRGMAVKGLDTDKQVPGQGKEAGEYPANQHEGGIDTMDWQKLMKMLARLFPGKTFTEDGVESELVTAMKASTEQAVKDATGPLELRIKELEPHEAKVKELTPLAAAGKTYVDDLVDRYIKAKAKLDEKKYETADSREKLKTLAQGFELDFLKSEVEDLEARVDEKFPAGSELTDGKDPEKKQVGKAKKSLRPDK